MTDVTVLRLRGGTASDKWRKEFSNFFIEPDGTHVEGEYQAAKHDGHPIRQRLIRNATPRVAKRLGRRWKLNRYQMMEWDHRKNQVMYGLVKRKFEDHPALFLLLSCFDGEIVEVNNWHDNYWGDCVCMRCYKIGENNLGKILMRLRDEITE